MDIAQQNRSAALHGEIEDELKAELETAQQSLGELTATSAAAASAVAELREDLAAIEALLASVWQSARPAAALELRAADCKAKLRTAEHRASAARHAVNAARATIADLLRALQQIGPARTVAASNIAPSTAEAA